jgi:hypothetical protein
MSLINDALKRAREAERQRGSTQPDMPLQPVEPVRRNNPSSRGLVVGIVVVALGFSIWFFAQWANTNSPSPESQLAGPTDTPAPVGTPSELTNIAPTLSPSPAPIAEIQSTPLPTVAADQDSQTVPDLPTDTPVALDPTSTLQPGAAADAPAPPPSNDPLELRLQSIIYRQRNPIVVINGQMLQKGDSIADAQIIDIQRDQVTLSRNETNWVLTMPRY